MSQKIYSIYLNEDEQKQLEALQKAYNSRRATDVWRRILSTAFVKDVPRYAEAYNDIDLNGLTKEDREIKKAEAKALGAVRAGEIKQKQKLARLEGICHALGGTSDGELCTYMQYEKLNDTSATEHEVVIPLAQLNEADVEEHKKWYITKDEYDTIMRAKAKTKKK